MTVGLPHKKAVIQAVAAALAKRLSLCACNWVLIDLGTETGLKAEVEVAKRRTTAAESFMINVDW